MLHRYKRVQSLQITLDSPIRPRVTCASNFCKFNLELRGSERGFEYACAPRGPFEQKESSWKGGRGRQLSIGACFVDTPVLVFADAALAQLTPNPAHTHRRPQAREPDLPPPSPPAARSRSRRGSGPVGGTCGTALPAILTTTMPSLANGLVYMLYSDPGAGPEVEGGSAFKADQNCFENGGMTLFAGLICVSSLAHSSPHEPPYTPLFQGVRVDKALYTAP